MMLRTEFEQELGRLKCLRFPPIDLDGHYAGLKDIPLAEFQKAVTLALKSRSEFPTVAELLNDADASNRKPSTVIPFPQSVKLETPIKQGAKSLSKDTRARTENPLAHYP